ncbi:DUF3592 domain-containing protein [Acaryochloris sp. IP29b_bin.137]|uniref:DUF3592 domain-containing protein n=1 Tax=Acaryochloris sp. IP29b_bin.137 TaxID=2969217 RepID=UPI0026395374|nr:DUF3592 domain-containing protein [Acaryochloris sp. IP29b_bin.137]
MFSEYHRTSRLKARTIATVGVLLMIGAVLFARWTYGWVSTATVVDGQVIEIIARRSESGRSPKVTYAPRVAYELDEQVYQFVPLMSASLPEFEVGELVKVVISSNREREAIGSFWQLYAVPTLLFLVGIVLALPMVVIQAGDQLLEFLHPTLKDD